MLRPTLIAAAMFTVLVVEPSHAIEKCRIKVDKKTGVIRVDASGVGGPVAWGSATGQASTPFFNAATCAVGGTARKCELADPAMLAAKTPPQGCTLYLDDGVVECSAWISGCTPTANLLTQAQADGLYAPKPTHHTLTLYEDQLSGTIHVNGSGGAHVDAWNDFLAYDSPALTGSPVAIDLGTEIQLNAAGGLDYQVALTFRFTDGDLTLFGLYQLSDGTGRYAIIGGTGAYARAIGTATSSLPPPYAVHTFTLDYTLPA
jgi:hypothetical protein